MWLSGCTKKTKIILEAGIFLLMKRWIYRENAQVDLRGFKASGNFNGSCQTIVHSVK